MGADSLVPYLVGLLVAVLYTWQYVYSEWLSFEMNASGIESQALTLQLVMLSIFSCAY